MHYNLLTLIDVLGSLAPASLMADTIISYSLLGDIMLLGKANVDRFDEINNSVTTLLPFMLAMILMLYTKGAAVQRVLGVVPCKKKQQRTLSFCQLV